MISDNSSKHITAMENSKANSKKNARLGAVQRVLQRQTLTLGCHANYMRDALCPLHTREPVPTVNSSTAGSHEMATSKTVTKSTLIMLQTQLCFSQYHLFFGQTLPTGHRTGMIHKKSFTQIFPPLYTFFREFPKYYPPRQFTCCNDKSKV